MNKIWLIFLSGVFLLFSCVDYSPKPYGYFRIDLKEHSYKNFPENNYFSFQYSSDARIDTVSDPASGIWFDINYPSLNAKIHCSYLPVTPDNFNKAAEDSHKFVYRHVLKADAINEELFQSQEEKIYGILYQIKGNVASPIQFLLTDSAKHFFRGALYFDTTPNQDSLAPVINYINDDIYRLVNTFSWKTN